MDGIWDDPSRPSTPTEFQHSKSHLSRPDVSTEKSTVSLSKLYEQDYKVSKGEKQVISSSISPELVSLWDQVSYALDSLSHFQFATTNDKNLIKSSNELPSFSTAQLEKGVAIHAASLSNSQASSLTPEEINAPLKSPLRVLFSILILL